MKRLQFVVHCWRYSRVLAYQLSSLILNSTEKWDDVICTVFYARDDQPTADMLNYFRSKLSLVAWPLSLPELQRREIGRNLAARDALGDVVWFTDADYVFGSECLNTLAVLSDDFADDMIYYPRRYMGTITRDIGDAIALKVTGPGLYAVDSTDFEPNIIDRAIGGAQIVTGDTARKHGYCPNDRPPPTDSPGFFFKSDRWYRHLFKSERGIRIVLPNLYRIRQSVSSRVDTL